MIETLQLSGDGNDESDPMESLNYSKVPVLIQVVIEKLVNSFHFLSVNLFPKQTQYLAKNGIHSKLDDVNETFAVAASTSNSTE